MRITTSKLRNAVLRAGVLFCLPLSLISADLPKRVNLNHLVVIGDSLSAGFQNFSLLHTQQRNSYAAMVAQQAGVELELPLIADPGFPSALELLQPGLPPVLGARPPADPLRLSLNQPTNLAVPGMTLHEVVYSRPGEPSFVAPFRDLVLGIPAGLPQSQLEKALTLSPTAVIAWAGANDALLPLLTGDMSALTPIEAFQADIETLFSKLEQSGATVITANLPDVTMVPYLLPAETFASALGVDLSTIGPLLGIEPGDYLRPTAVPVALAILADPQTGPLPQVCAVDFLALPPAPCVLRAGDARKIRQAVRRYNLAISDAALRHGAVMVDIFALVRSLDRHGYVVGNQRLTMDYMGGLVSLDGMHPTNTLNAIIANEFIQAMNTRLGTRIKRVAVKDIFDHDPLAVGAGHPVDSGK